MIDPDDTELLLAVCYACIFHGTQAPDGLHKHLHAAWKRRTADVNAAFLKDDLVTFEAEIRDRQEKIAETHRALAELATEATK